MKFTSYNANLRIEVTPPKRSVIDGYLDVKPGEYAQFRGRMYETDDADRIKFLKRHRLFSERQNDVGKFWEYVEPVDHEAESLAKDARIAELESQLAKAKTADKEKQKKAGVEGDKEPGKEVPTSA